MGEFNSILPQSDLYSLGVLLINLLIPTLTPIVIRKLNFDKEMIKKDLNDWKIYLRTKKVSEYRSKISKYVKSVDESSPFDPLLLQLSKIALNLTKSNPYHRNYLPAAIK